MKNLIGLGLMLGVVFLGCQKEEGIGGKSTIKGNLRAAYVCSETGDTTAQAALSGVRVYISYGDNETFDDDVRTGVNGAFVFDFLHEGTYTISVISECHSCTTASVLISETVEVGNDEEIELGNIVTTRVDNEFCTGPGEGGITTASGLLSAIYIDSFTLDTIGEAPLPDERVYLVYGTGQTASDDVRSSADGTFQFRELRPGNYRVYAYSDCEFCIGGTEASFVDFTISPNQQTVAIPELNVVVLD